MIVLKNAKGKAFSWSPSAIADYISCPAQYAARRFYETLPYVETEAMRAGTVEHEMLEKRLRDKTPLPEGFTRGEKYCTAIEKSAQGGQVMAELELAIDRAMKFVRWFDKSAYGRCKIDILALRGQNCFIGDWKSGNIKENSLQLKINACFISLRHAELEQFNTKYIWLKHNAATGETFKKAQIPELWDEIFGWIRRIEDAWQTETFPPKASGLCKNYCSVTSCRYCGKGGRG